VLQDIAFDSISKRIVEKAPVEETLGEILDLIMTEPSHALARIWLVKRGDICATCSMRGECPDQTKCLHLTASIGRDSKGKITWRGLDGRFRRFPLGVRKVGFTAETGESVQISDLGQSEHSWIVDREWIRHEGIKSVAAHPLRIQEDIFGVISVFSRENFTDENFRWLRIFADQASIAIANARAFVEIGRLREKLREENEYLREEIHEASQHTFLIGESPAWKTILQQIDLVAGSDATVLVSGESGTGKELVARAIHESSPRRENALVRVNCAAISPELFESEFFGHTKGSFTGAVRDRPGRFQLADGGTIFLDEIGELPLNMQGKLLRVIQERQFERVGEDRTNTVDVRIIAATNRDLAAEVRKGSFREDLYYRLNVFPITVPPLRERPEDIKPLTLYFVDRFAKGMRCRPLEVFEADIELLKSYAFPGNVRELENIVERAMILSQCDQLNISLPHVLDRMIVRREELQPPKERVLTIEEMKQIERENIVRALKWSNYKVYGEDGAASLIGSKPTTLISKIKKLGIPMRPSA
jgi:transcriptional regulator with GAF, ATPase, and Fis domain